MALLAAAQLALVLASAAAPPSSVVAPSTASSVGTPARYLVVIGYNGGAPDPHPPLRFGDDDAARLFMLLSPSAERAFLLATFDAESARLFPDLTSVAREPTREQLAQVMGEVQWLERAKKKEGRATELVFAFAGHGDVDDGGEGFIVLADGPFKRSDLEAQVIDPSPADVNHLIIDACSSFYMVPRGGNAVSGSAALTPQVLDVLKGTTSSAAARARTGVIVSTSGAAEVHESAELESGVFSFLLRSALAGAADDNGDGRVEYVEAAAFIGAASAGLDDPRAKLSVHAEAPLQRPHTPLADLLRSGATRFLKVESSSSPVHIRVIDAHGVPYAELHAQASHAPVILALAQDPFYVVQDGSTKREALLVPRAAGAYAYASLTFEDAPAPRRASPAGIDHLRGLFAQPYGNDVVAGFLGASQMAPPLAGPAFDPPWAKSGEPPLRLHLGSVGLVTLGAAAVVGVAAGVAVAGDQLAFQKLQSDFNRTGALDPQTSLEVESWRTAASALTLGAVALGLAGGGLYLWSTTLPEGEVTLR